MKKLAYQRHDISGHVGKFWSPCFPGAWGGNARNNRQFVNAVFWMLRTGAPWINLPPSYGDWKNTHRRFCRWRDKNVWEKILEALMNEPDYEWLMIDATHIKAHQHAAGARGGNQAIGLTKGGEIQKYIWPWMRMVCRSELLLQQVPSRIARKLVL
jgi:transposase